MKYPIITSTFLSISLALTSGALAQSPTVIGEVKKIDESAGKITLKHGPIKNLDMQDESMTMVFRVQAAAMLKQVKVGDKVDLTDILDQRDRDYCIARLRSR